ncbi:hypothetical protein J3R83DRAFT_7255 [Lanmaoa asiatica]|nr:hypothetical protein J3R83DRAFT_7255 [Lanmaoa asiatica]
MFTRFSFSLSRIFRLGSRRGAKANDSSARFARRTSSDPSPSKSRRPTSWRLESINTTPNSSTTRPRSFFIRSLLSPIAHSPITTSPGVTPIPDALTPILIIGHDPAQSTLPPPPAPVPPTDVRPQTQVDGGLLLETPPMPTHHNTRRVSFQLPTTHTEEPPESPLSTCSTLVTDVETQAQAEIEPAVPPEQPFTTEAFDSGSVWAASVELDVGLDNVVRSGSRKARPASLLSPLPVRVDLSRFSLPVTPTTPTRMANTNARDDRRESNRTSPIPPVFGSGSGKKEKRMSRWSRELNKPETQEALRVLRGL